MSDDRWILVPGELARKVEAAELCFNGDLVERAIEQYLTHLLRCRKHKKGMRDNPDTKDAWYERRRVEAARYRAKCKKAKDVVVANTADTETTTDIESPPDTTPTQDTKEDEVRRSSLVVHPASDVCDEAKLKRDRLEMIRRRAEEQ